uniref:Cytochrome c biogenesis protein CcsA n=1 Tax=Cylindrocystis brebissonii TaxID=102167 RepID=A0A191T5Z6_9VIRI|nr:heme attachment to plastid cytochrome c [Cylindrocystis brebissonii]ANI25826.1 heme attachment to plastid cytochrome c [Cylindrocystis brebissonii]
MILTNFEELIKECNLICLFLSTCLLGGKVTFLTQKNLTKLTSILMFVSTCLLTVLLVLRWKISGHFPLSNLYESCLFLAWTLTICHVLVQSQMTNNWLSILTVPSVLLIQIFSMEGISINMQQTSFLVPALKSNWLMMHVSMMIFSYSILFLGSLLAITLLVFHYQINNSKQKLFLLRKNLSFSSSNLFILQEVFLNTRTLVFIQQLDYWSYRAINIGFIFLTIGIFSGAVWANEAWGSFWSWDPKETWALITWFIFATYLHTRMIPNWSESKRALIALLGFFIVWICYLGVNLLGKGLHSYGWLK